MKSLKIKTNIDYYNNFNNYNDDSGFDLYTPNDITIKPFKLINKGTLVNLEIQCEMIDNNNNVGYYLYPRSSIYKTPLRLSNSVGIIDAGYRGNIMACVDNHSDSDYIIKKGTRLFQICAGDLSIFNIEKINELSNTNRNTGGFGSTGN